MHGWLWSQLPYLSKGRGRGKEGEKEEESRECGREEVGIDMRGRGGKGWKEEWGNQWASGKR